MATYSARKALTNSPTLGVKYTVKAGDQTAKTITFDFDTPKLTGTTRYKWVPQVTILNSSNAFVPLTANLSITFPTDDSITLTEVTTTALIATGNIIYIALVRVGYEA